VLRTSKFSEMIEFYKNTIGPDIYMKFENSCFFKISEDIEGHPQLIAVFKENFKSNGPNEPKLEKIQIKSSSLHHFAFVMEKDEFEKQKDFLQEQTVELRYDKHIPQKWESIYLYDPTGNTVEFVCYNPKIKLNDIQQGL